MKNIILFIALLSLILAVRFVFFFTNTKTYQKGQYVEFETQILSVPKEYSQFKTMSVRLDGLNRVLLKIPLATEFSYGDYLKIAGKLDVLVLKDNSTIFTIDNPKIEANFRENYLKTFKIYFIRQKIIDVFNANLDKKSADLLLGIVFGIKQNISSSFLKEIQNTGLTHVIAASGMNVTLVSGFIFYFLSLIFKRQLAIALSVLGILFYVCLAGFEPSIIRAAIMGIVVFASQILGREQYSFLTLLFTGFLMLFISPEYILSIGFQLSFAATIGIVYLPKYFQKYSNALTQDLITTTSAQITTLPILLLNFGTFSLISILVNTLVLWTIPILMILGSVAAISSFIFPLLTTFILYLCLPFLIYFEKIVSIFANLPLMRFDNFPWQFAAAYYFFLFSILTFKYLRK